MGGKLAKSTKNKEAVSLKTGKNNLKLKSKVESEKKSKSLSKINKVNSKKKEKDTKEKQLKAKSEKAHKTKVYEQLILDHRENGRKLSRSILRRWRVHMPGEEIDSIVDLALCEAAQRFSAKKGASFMTFFFYHLRGHLVRAVTRATQAATILNGPKELDESETTLDIISSYGTFIDNELNAQRDQENPEQIILRREKILSCRDALSVLDELEQVVLERSYSDDETLVDIAKSLGYSRCHISRVKKAAMIRIKNVLSNSSLYQDSAFGNSRKTIIRSKRSEKGTRRKLKHIKKIDKNHGSKAA